AGFERHSRSRRALGEDHRKRAARERAALALLAGFLRDRARSQLPQLGGGQITQAKEISRHVRLPKSIGAATPRPQRRDILAQRIASASSELGGSPGGDRIEVLLDERPVHDRPVLLEIL